MFPNLSRNIAKLYKWLGLISIPVLTVVTAVSVANVFTRGQLAQSQWIQMVWAVIFAAAIEVNIVRLFFEAKHDHDTPAKTLGIGLIIVAGVSLIIEGIQQSIGFDWSNVWAQGVVGSVVGLRVIVVMFLLAREGSRLASMLPDTEQEVAQSQYCLVQFAPPIDTVEEARVIQEIDTPPAPIRMLPQHKNTDTLSRVHAVLKDNPTVSIRALAAQAGVSPNTAKKYKAQLKEA